MKNLKSDNLIFTNAALNPISAKLRQSVIEFVVATLSPTERTRVLWDDLQLALKRTAIDPGQHYRMTYTVKLSPEDIARGEVTIKLDPFRIADIYKQSDFAALTILKKVLVPGNRGHKDIIQDFKDIIGAAERKLEMMAEDAR